MAVQRNLTTVGFCAPNPVYAQGHHYRPGSVSAKPAFCHERVWSCQPVRAALIVVDLSVAIEAGDASKDFKERIEVDRAAQNSSSGHRASFLLYSSADAHPDILQRVQEAGLPEADAVSATGGLYQRGYITPDPYLGSQIWSDWDPKPTRWVVETFFKDSLSEREASNDEEGAQLEIALDLKKGDDVPAALDVRETLAQKLSELGIKGDVNMRGGSDSNGCLVVRPAQADLGIIVDFCGKMLGMDKPASICVFGKKDFVESYVSSNENSVGIVGRDPLDTEEESKSTSGRVFVSKHSGVAALLDGVVHYAVF